jgi:hypothetical protein
VVLAARTAFEACIHAIARRPPPSDDRAAIILFAAATGIALLLIVVTLVIAIPRVTKRRTEAWRAIGGELGLRFTPGGSGLLHRPALLEGVFDGVALRVDTMSTGRRHLTRVRANAEARAPLEGRTGPLEALGARQVSLIYDGPHVSLSWLGWETDVATMRAACVIVAAIARGH